MVIASGFGIWNLGIWNSRSGPAPGLGPSGRPSLRPADPIWRLESTSPDRLSQRTTDNLQRTEANDEPFAIGSGLHEWHRVDRPGAVPPLQEATARAVDH